MKPRLYFLILLLTGSVTAPARSVPITGVDTATAGFVGLAVQGPLDSPVIVTSFAEFASVFGAATAGLANPYLAPSVAAYFANGGVRLAVVRVGGADDLTLIGSDGGSSGTRTGLQALRDVEEVSFVAIPGVATPAVQAALIAHCESEGDRMAILDPADPADVAAVQIQRAGLASGGGYAALYFPWLQAALTGVSQLLPPSGFVAGSYAAHDPPDAPVGVIATAAGVAVALTPSEQDLLNSQNINTIRDLSGIRIWGARTISASNEWRYVSVRRMALYIAESVSAGTEWCLGVDNDAALWTTLTQDLDAFLSGLYFAGWFAGSSAAEAYFGACGLTTMTQGDIDAGRTILLVGFAAVRPAEFVVLEVVHQRPDATGVPMVGPALVDLAAPVPNPFNPATTLRFDLGRDAWVSLRVYDLAGRLVRTILDGSELAAGTHRRRWAGQDDAGRAVGSGVYCLRIQAAGERRSQRLVLVR